MIDIDLFIFHGISKKVKIVDLFQFGELIKDLIDDKFSVNVYPIEYNHLLEKKEDLVYKRQIRTHRWRKACFFSSYFVSDALACHQKERPLSEGDFVHDLWGLLEKNYDMVSHQRPDSFKILLSHSMGSEHALSFCFRRRIDFLVTMGSPIDWYSSAFAKCEFPPMVKLWTNFYNRWDPVHSTVGHFSSRSESGADVGVVEDVDVTTFLPFMLMAHSSYWSNKKVHKHIAKRINQLVKADS